MSAPARSPSVGTPRAEADIDAALVRSLLRDQLPDLADLPIAPVAAGWDNAMFRLGADLAVRLPRRELAAALILHEQRWLPALHGILPVRIPVPLRVGVGHASYPWPWSVVPWLQGETADLMPLADDQGEVLGRFLTALHRAAPAEAPANPFRGVPLVTRADAFAERATRIASRGVSITGAIHSIWQAALSAPIDAAPTWIHGDLHPRNVLVTDGRLHAVIDWGDLCSGDPATDLASLWMLLGTRASRLAAMRACPAVTDSTWARARGWAVLFSMLLLDAGLADDPRMARIAERTMSNLCVGP